MAHRDTINETQVDVLRWVADGSEAGVYGGRGHRITAAALTRRGLVEVEGRGASWAAKITTAGRLYLDRVDSSAPPIARQGKESVTQQLVDEVIAAGGTATFPRRGDSRVGDIDYARRASLARLHGKVPSGTQLVVTTNRDNIEISLIDVDAQQVPVPGRVGRLHQVALTFRDDRSRHEVTRAELGRATRIVHVLATEAERRGLEVLIAHPRTRRSGASRWSGPEDGHVVIRSGDHEARIRISEAGLSSRAYFDRTNGSYVVTADGHYKQRSLTLADYEANATGRLRLELVDYSRSPRIAKWADSRTWRLEDNLGEVLWEIETRNTEARQARSRAAVEAQRRQQQWEAAMEAARAAIIEHRRLEALRWQVAPWREAAQIRAWCDAASARYPHDADTTTWIAWARDHAKRLDSLSTPPT